MQNHTRHPVPVATPPDANLHGASPRWREHLHRVVQVLGTAGSMIPFGDNGELFRALAKIRKPN